MCRNIVQSLFLFTYGAQKWIQTFEMQKSIQALQNSFEHFYDAQKGCLNLSMMH